MRHPTVKTKDYETSCKYEEGMEVYLYNGKFTTNPGPPGGSNKFMQLAVVTVPPSGHRQELELMLVGEDWDLGGYERHKIANEIANQMARPGKNHTIVVMPHSIFSKVREHCSDIFDPCTVEGERHAGQIYGLLVYVSHEADRIMVF